MKNKEKDQAQQNGQAAANPGGKKKFVITDKMIYIALAVILCFIIFLTVIVPEMINKAIDRNFKTEFGTTNAVALDNNSEKAGLMKGAQEIIAGLKGGEAEMLAVLPENIKNKKFASVKEKAGFFSGLAEKYKVNDQSLEKMSQKQLAAIYGLSYLYGMEAYLEDLEEGKADQNNLPAALN